MTYIIVIVVVFVILYFLFSQTKTEERSYTENPKRNLEFSKFEIINNDEILTDENGLKYRWVKKIRKIPRHTFIKAVLNGKYWGEIDENYSNQFAHSKFYDFNIYEATLKNAVYNSHSPFLLEQDLRIPRERLPKLLPAIFQQDGKEYEVNLHEPIFSEIKFNRKLHQDEGNEVFGTIDAIVAGYILDFTTEEYLEKEYIIQPGVPGSNPSGTGSTITETNRGERTYTKPAGTSSQEGCFSTIIGVIVTLVGIAFILLMLPYFVFLLPILLIIFLLKIIPEKFFNWLFTAIVVLIYIGFFLSLLQIFFDSAKPYIPKPIVVENAEEQKTQSEPIIDTVDNNERNDTLIKHYRIWEDYDGNKYEGYIWTKQSDYQQAKLYKNSLKIQSNTLKPYDEIIYLLKENDKNNLGGIYQLFDSIKVKKQLSNIKFAELIVSFVQDIPYAIIVPDDCNPNLYDDKFIKEYLNSENARCNGFQKFGINSPVEFMSNLYGDCDTRTLLLYTMLAHYGYDVALFSSEYYSHSIIGINLPFSGIAFKYGNQNYVLWGTTAKDIKAGILPPEISNLKYWRISLKSK